MSFFILKFHLNFKFSKLFYHMLGIGWTFIAMLLAVVIALINVCHKWIFKFQWKAQKHLAVKLFSSFLTRKGIKKTWDITASNWNLNHLDSFSANLCVSTWLAFYEGIFSISMEEIYLFSLSCHVFCNFFTLFFYLLI